MKENLKKPIKILIYYTKKLMGCKFVDYHYFPFNPMQTLPKGSENELKKSCEFLINYNITYRISDGTVLGIYRDNAFIKHDNDIDIDVLDVKDPKLFLTVFRNFFTYEIGRIVYFKKKIQQITFYNKKGVIVDFIFWYTNGDDVFNYQEKGFIRTQKLKYFKTLDNYNFNGFLYKIPGYIEEWLQFRYGNDWKIPKTYKGDWKEECGDITCIDPFKV